MVAPNLLDPTAPPTGAPSLVEQAQGIADKNAYTAQTNTFDESKGVAGRVKSITDSGSPLMESAGTRGTQQAASRGLVNSSLASQASQQAVLDSATPIAAADAGLFQQNSLANQAATNTARSQNANAGVQLGGSAQALSNSNTQQDKSLAQQAQQFGMTSGQSQQQIDAQNRQFDVGTGITQQQIDARAREFGISAEQARAQLEQQASQFKVSTGITQQQIDARAKEFGITAEQAKQQIEAQQAQFNVTSGIAQQQVTNQVAQQKASLAQQAVLANLDADTRTAVANTEKAWRTDLTNNANIQAGWSEMMKQIGVAQSNPNLDDAARAVHIQNAMDNFAGFANFWKKSTGSVADVSDLLNFKIPVPAPAPAPEPAPAPAPPPDSSGGGGFGGDGGSGGDGPP